MSRSTAGRGLAAAVGGRYFRVGSQRPAVTDGYSRRAALGFVGGGGLAGLAGCARVLGPDRTRIGELVFLNMDETAHRVRVAIEAGEERLFEATRRVPPRDETQPVLSPTDGLPTARRRYAVTARLDDGADAIRRTYPLDRGGDCYSVTVRIDTDGTFRDMPVITNFDGCPAGDR